MAQDLNIAQEVVTAIQNIRTETAEVLARVNLATGDTNMVNEITSLALDLIQACQAHKEAAISTVLLNKNVESFAINHSVDTAIIAYFSSARLNWGDRKKESLVSAALTMNLTILDKLDKLFYKKDALTKEDKKAVYFHPMDVVEKLKSVGVQDEFWLEAIASHHEYADGSGFPEGLEDKQTPTAAKLICAADNYCQLVSPRAYREAIPPNFAIMYLFSPTAYFKQHISTQFAPMFYDALTVYPPGSIVEFSEDPEHADEEPGIRAIVLRYHQESTMQTLDVYIQPDPADVDSAQNSVLTIGPEKVVRVLPHSCEANEFDLVTLWSDEHVKGHITERVSLEGPVFEAAAGLLYGVSLPSMPKVINKLELETQKKEPDIDKIADLVSRDVNLTGMVLSTATSLLKTSHLKIASVKQGVMQLGVHRFKRTVLISAVSSLVQELSPKLERFWQRNIEEAEVASSLAKTIKDIPTDIAYLTVLLSNSGYMVMAADNKDILDRLLGDARVAPFTCPEFENDNFETNHSVIGYLIATEWKIPEDICQAVLLHHSKNIEQIDNIKIRQLISIVLLATFIVDRRHHKDEEISPQNELVLDKSLNELGLTADDIKAYLH